MFKSHNNALVGEYCWLLSHPGLKVMWFVTRKVDWGAECEPDGNKKRNCITHSCHLVYLLSSTMPVYKLIGAQSKKKKKEKKYKLIRKIVELTNSFSPIQGALQKFWSWVQTKTPSPWPVRFFFLIYLLENIWNISSNPDTNSENYFNETILTF